MTHANIQDAMISAVAKQMQLEIDKELMETIQAEHLLSNGWRESPVRKSHGPLQNWEWETETAAWCHLHCTGDYKYVLSHWWFENASDATAFTLKFA